jgi:hypothetical protein
MQTSIKIGPIQKGKVNRVSNTNSILKDRLSKMKNGNYFNISGLSSRSEVNNIRAAISYLSKKESVQVTTTMKNGVLLVQKIKSIKTKESSLVK